MGRLFQISGFNILISLWGFTANWNYGDRFRLSDRLWLGRPMFENLTWRNVVVLITVLTIAGCLIASGIIIATDPAVRHKAAATQKIHPFKVERAARIDW